MKIKPKLFNPVLIIRVSLELPKTDCHKRGHPAKIVARKNLLIDWLIVYVYCPDQEYFNHIGTSPFPVNAFKMLPLLGACDLWVRRDLYRATRDMARPAGPWFTRSHSNIAPYSRYYDKPGILRTYSVTDPYRLL